MKRLDEFDEFNAACLTHVGSLTLPLRTAVEVWRFRGARHIEMDVGAAAKQGQPDVANLHPATDSV